MKGLPFFNPAPKEPYSVLPLANTGPIQPTAAEPIHAQPQTNAPRPAASAQNPSGASSQSTRKIYTMEITEAPPLSMAEQQQYDLILSQLKHYSGKNYEISIKYFKDDGLYNPAISFSGKFIMIDRRLFSFPIEVLAFSMAHEWGHNLYKHNLLLEHTKLNMAQAIAMEDQADNYAIAFLVAHGYKIDPVCNFLTKINNEGGQPAAGTVRNQKLRQNYEQQLIKKASVSPQATTEEKQPLTTGIKH